MAGGRGAENGEVRPRLPHASADIVKHPVRGNGEISDRVGHPGGLRIADADDLRIGVLVRLTQQVAHVGVLETDAGDPRFSHVSLPCDAAAARAV